MPLKEFICKSCGKKFEKLTKADTVKEICPDCKSECTLNFNGKCNMAKGGVSCGGNCGCCGGCGH